MGRVDNKTLWPPVTYPTPPSKENITAKEEKNMEEDVALVEGHEEVQSYCLIHKAKIGCPKIRISGIAPPNYDIPTLGPSDFSLFFELSMIC